MSEANKPDVIQTELNVTVRGETYTFRIPSIRYDIEVATRAARIRRLADPGGSTALYELGSRAMGLSWSLAQIELYLIASSAKWPFSAGAGGEPAVDHTKFDARQARLVSEIGEAFEAEYARFLG